eukprot:TRINITY_DN28263_c0_g9_i2.p1 TRINITY_DN28263_c0_g9~~TRINITY_DN28263_c0_g9_i2.p1  ORF type:complete len:223 (-),score=47.57 TRINITY_DN28263_c0_g9_i2:50-676(-)
MHQSPQRTLTPPPTRQYRSVLVPPHVATQNRHHRHTFGGVGAFAVAASAKRQAWARQETTQPQPQQLAAGSHPSSASVLVPVRTCSPELGRSLRPLSPKAAVVPVQASLSPSAAQTGSSPRLAGMSGGSAALRASQGSPPPPSARVANPAPSNAAAAAAAASQEALVQQCEVKFRVWRGWYCSAWPSGLLGLTPAATMLVFEFEHGAP